MYMAKYKIDMLEYVSGLMIILFVVSVKRNMILLNGKLWEFKIFNLKYILVNLLNNMVTLERIINSFKKHILDLKWSNIKLNVYRFTVIFQLNDIW